MNWLEKSWYKQGYWSYLLAPLSLLFFVISSLRRLAFRLGLTKQKHFSIPVVVVGNITVGGTGKTPFVVYLVKLLQGLGFKPAIVSRGYGAEDNAEVPFPRIVTAQMPTNLSGDEPKLLAMKTGVPVIISPKRADAVALVSQTTDCDLVISDDGLQHYAMGRDMEIVLLDQQRGLGNGWLLPVGPLREGAGRLKSVDLTIENSGFNTDSSLDYRLKPSLPYHISNKQKTLSANAKVKLISGIGNPQRFLDTAQGLGLKIDGTIWLPDHHNFTLDDFKSFGEDDIIVMTEKDAVKCTGLMAEKQNYNWFVLPIEACISSAVEQQIIEKIKRIT